MKGRVKGRERERERERERKREREKERERERERGGLAVSHGICDYMYTSHYLMKMYQTVLFALPKFFWHNSQGCTYGGVSGVHDVSFRRKETHRM